MQPTKVDKEHERMIDDLLLGKNKPAKETVILPERPFDEEGNIRSNLLKTKEEDCDGYSKKY